MGVIDEHLCTAHEEPHESARVVGRVTTETREHIGDRRRRNAKGGGGEGGARQVGDVVPRAALQRQRHRIDGSEVVLASLPGQVQPAVAHSGRCAVVLPVLAEFFALAVEREPAERR